MGKKTRRSKEKKQGDDVPPHLREFISSIGENQFCMRKAISIIRPNIERTAWWPDQYLTFDGVEEQTGQKTGRGQKWFFAFKDLVFQFWKSFRTTQLLNIWQLLYFRPFFVAALKELPDDPAALKRAAKNKRKQKEAATEESGTSVRSMMTGVTICYADNDYLIMMMMKAGMSRSSWFEHPPSLFFSRATNSLTWTSWTCGTASGLIFQKVHYNW